MPIHDLSYRHWDGPLRGAGSRWRVIAASGLRLLLARRAFLVLLLLSWVPFFIQGGIVYFTLVRAQVVDLAVGPQFFQISLYIQIFPMVLVAVFAGSGLIASDRAAGALPLYFAKPITRLDYITGKFSILAACLGSVYLAPPLLLFLFAAGVAPDMTFVKQNWWVLFSVLGYGILVVVLASIFMLALSSTARSGRIVGVAFIAVGFFSDLIGTLFSVISRSDWPLALSVVKNMQRLSDAFFRQPPSVALPWELSLLAGVFVLAVSVLVLARRVRPVEIVA
jgi:ABC-2 type transport system permease protein